MKKNNGFTIIELLVAVSIVGIIAALAIPSFSTVIENRRVSSAAATVSSVLTVARSEALTQLRNASVCWNTAAGIDNSNGFAIASNSMAVFLPAVGAIPLQVIKNVEYDDGSISITDSSAVDCINYDSQGRVTGGGGDIVFGFCRGPGDSGRSQAVTLTLAGRSIIQSNTTGGGFLINCPP